VTGNHNVTDHSVKYYVMCLFSQRALLLLRSINKVSINPPISSLSTARSQGSLLLSFPDPQPTMRAQLWNRTCKPAPSGCLSLCASQSLAARFHTSSARPKLVRNPTEEGSDDPLAFPTNDWGNFGDLRKAPGMIYWDKSMFIHKLQKLPRTLLFCRPRNLGSPIPFLC